MQEIRAPRGFNDFLPGSQFGWQDTYRWQYLEQVVRRTSKIYGFQELRPPMIEMTEAFVHGTGSTSDVVSREMFGVIGRGDKEGYSLRPEFTVGMARAYLEHKLGNSPQPVKVYTYGPCFRYERPQAGRYRQLHQWDAEVFGAKDASVDAELIKLGLDLVSGMGIQDLTVRINSIGCPVCRPDYREQLIRYFKPHVEDLCEDCQHRLERNPMRLLDCKKDASHIVMKDAPVMLDHLCSECADHFEQLQQFLDAMNVRYEIDSRIVRGLDYYTKTVFEVHYPALGAQSTLWGGGRYDGLIEILGGPPIPGVGFGMGLDRLQLVLDTLDDTPFPERPKTEVFIAYHGETAKMSSLNLLYELRANGISSDMNYVDRSLKSQFKHANRLGVRCVAVIGEEEVKNGTVTVKNMETGNQSVFKQNEFISHYRQV